jgi:hypothetical protein
MVCNPCTFLGNNLKLPETAVFLHKPLFFHHRINHRYFNAEKILGILHLIGIFNVPNVSVRRGWNVSIPTF